MSIKQSLKKEIDINDKLQSMRGNPGWKIIEDYLDKTIEKAINNLLSASTEREIFYNQAVVIVIRELLEKIGISYKIANTAREKLKKYEEI